MKAGNERVPSNCDEIAVVIQRSDLMWIAARGMVLGALSILVFGCVSEQLNYNTLDLAATVDNLMTRQVLLNLGRFVDDPTTLPSQITLAAGTASTTASFSPSVTGIPLANSTTTTTTAAATVTRAAAISRGAAAMTLSGTDQWMQNWTLDPVNDPDQLRRLRFLYRYAVHDPKLMSELANPNLDFSTVYPVQLTTASVQSSGKSQGGSGTITVRDPTFLVVPRCVICLNHPHRVLTNQQSTTTGPLAISEPMKATDFHINRMLQKDWLLWSNGDQPIPADAIDLGAYGGHELYVRAGDLWRLSEFVLLVLDAITQSTLSASTQGTHLSGVSPAFTAGGRAILLMR
jgi:hypothetical protein